MQKKKNNSISNLFVKKSLSRITLVRVACHFYEFNKTLKIIKELKKLGYKVAINLMQISQHSDAKINEIGKKLKLSIVDVVYFADSLGSMSSDDIQKIVNILRNTSGKEIGVHTHDNLGKAISNNLAAIKSDVSWVDSTVTGMGRGAGNGPTEYFLLELAKLYNIKLNLLPLLILIKKHFHNLKKKYEWGTNSYYYLAGLHGIHPTYIQEMIAVQFSSPEILEAINQLKNNSGSKYDVDLVRSEFQNNVKFVGGSWMPSKVIRKKNVLLIASGQNTKINKKAIERYIKLYKPYVIAVNTDVCINKKLINIYAASNPLKLIADISLYRKLSKPLVVPKTLLNNDLIKKLKKIKIYDYGIGLKENDFKFFKNGAVVPRLYTLLYALAIATSGDCSKIILAGFDGYGESDQRSKIVNQLFSQYASAKGAKKIYTITPTSYFIQSISLETLI